MKFSQCCAATSLFLLCSASVWGEDLGVPPVAVAADEQKSAAPEAAQLEYQVGVAGYLRGEAAEGFSLGDAVLAPSQRENQFVGRFQPYASWKPLDYLSFRVEGQWYGNRGSHHQKDSRFSLYQGYFDVSLPGSDVVSLRGGRQDFLYGSGFILVDDTFNDGLSFDALRLRIKPSTPLTVDILGGKYVSRFADDRRGDLAAIYGTYAFSDSSAVELYAFRDTGFQEGSTRDALYIWGGRLTAMLGPVAVEIEPVYETGYLHREAMGNKDSIKAYGGHLDLTMDNEWHGLKNKLFLGYALGSGSQDAVNGIRYNQEFRHPNSNASFSELISVIGDLSGIDADSSRASGIQSYSLGLGTDLCNGLNFTVNNHFFRAEKVPDGFSHNIGVETTSYLTWTPADSVSVVLAYTHLFSGGFFRDATGSSRDADIGYLALQFDLSKKKEKN